MKAFTIKNSNGNFVTGKYMLTFAGSGRIWKSAGAVTNFIRKHESEFGKSSMKGLGLFVMSYDFSSGTAAEVSLVEWMAAADKKKQAASKVGRLCTINNTVEHRGKLCLIVEDNNNTYTVEPLISLDSSFKVYKHNVSILNKKVATATIKALHQRVEKGLNSIK